ncbi:MAG: 2-dehydropantoate 2-reductase N-terminal domain-containing protein [Aestuariivirga sp.]
MVLGSEGATHANCDYGFRRFGGYVGAKLAQANEDVSFIARHSHLAAMQAQGLRVESPLGEIKLPHVSATDTPSEVGFVDTFVVEASVLSGGKKCRRT